MTKGIPYFPLECQLNDKVALIEAEFGLTGFAVVVKLFQKIYGQRGYYCEFTKEVALLFGKELGLGGNVVSEIVEAAIKRGIFDRKLYDEYNVLSSEGIQERYFEAVERRKKVEVKKEYLLLKCDQLPKNVYISGENVYISQKNADISKQRKEEERKEEDSRGEERAAEPPPPPAANDPQKRYGDYGNVLLTDKDYSKLVDKYGIKNVAKYIERADRQVQHNRKGKSYSDYYATIDKWMDEDGITKPRQTSYNLDEMFERDRQIQEALAND